MKYKDDSEKWHNKSKVLEATKTCAAKHEAEEWQEELERAAQQKASSANSLGNVGEFVAHYTDFLAESHSVEKSTASPHRFTRRQIAAELGKIQAKNLSSGFVSAPNRDVKPIAALAALESTFVASCHDALFSS